MIQMELVYKEITVPKVLEHVILKHGGTFLPAYGLFFIPETTIEPCKLEHCLINTGVIAVHY